MESISSMQSCILVPQVLHVGATGARSFVLCMQAVARWQGTGPWYCWYRITRKGLYRCCAHQHLQEGCVKDERDEVLQPLQPCLCKPRSSCCAGLCLRGLVLRQHRADNSQANQGTPAHRHGRNKLI